MAEFQLELHGRIVLDADETADAGRGHPEVAEGKRDRADQLDLRAAQPGIDGDRHRF